MFYLLRFVKSQHKLSVISAVHLLMYGFNYLASNHSIVTVRYFYLSIVGERILICMYERIYICILYICKSTTSMKTCLL
jgi:hypothetical protein